MSNSSQSMFESIKESLSKEKSTGTGYRNIIKMTAGNTYLGRIIPNVKEPKETFFHYFHHGWTSNLTGQYVDGICPTTWGDRCVICEDRFKIWKKFKETNDEKYKILSSLIRRLEKHLVNFYIINDPTEDENNNTVKVLRMGVNLYKKIQNAISGDDADEFGSRIFDLTEGGCNFKIKVETVQGEGNNRKFTNYNESRFTAPTAIPGMTPEKIKEVYDGIFNLPDLVTRESDENLKELLQTHLFGVDKSNSQPSESAVANAISNAEKEQAPVTSAPKSLPAKPTASDKETSDKIKQLLDGIDSSTGE